MSGFVLIPVTSFVEGGKTGAQTGRKKKALQDTATSADEEGPPPFTGPKIGGAKNFVHLETRMAIAASLALSWTDLEIDPIRPIQPAPTRTRDGGGYGDGNDDDDDNEDHDDYTDRLSCRGCGQARIVDNPLASQVHGTIFWEREDTIDHEVNHSTEALCMCLDM